MVTELLEFIHPHNMNVALVTSKFPQGPQKYERYLGVKKGSEKNGDLLMLQLFSLFFALSLCAI